MSGSITLNLNVRDQDGFVVDGVTSELTIDQASDIVDQASELILMRRAGKDITAQLDALEEALSSADVIEPPGARTRSR